MWVPQRHPEKKNEASLILAFAVCSRWVMALVVAILRRLTLTILSVSKRNGPQPPPSHIKPISFGNELRTFDLIPYSGWLTSSCAVISRLKTWTIAHSQLGAYSVAKEVAWIRWLDHAFTTEPARFVASEEQQRGRQTDRMITSLYKNMSPIWNDLDRWKNTDRETYWSLHHESFYENGLRVYSNSAYAIDSRLCGDKALVVSVGQTLTGTSIAHHRYPHTRQVAPRNTPIPPILTRSGHEELHLLVWPSSSLPNDVCRHHHRSWVLKYWLLDTSWCALNNPREY